MSLSVTLYSHHFAISGVTAYYAEFLQRFANERLVEISVDRDSWGNITRTPLRVYAVRSKIDFVYRFHINLWAEFQAFMTQNSLVLNDVKQEPMYTPAVCQFQMQDGWVPFENQKPVIEYLVAEGVKKVVDAATGSGKTTMSLFALCEINQRVAMVIRPMFIDRWLDELCPGPKQSLKGFGHKDVLVIRGSASFRSMLFLAQENELRAKFIVISNRTLANYYESYTLEGATEEYAFVEPHDLWKLLGVGVRLIDEAHMDFYACFMSDLYTHVPKSIELSGTLHPDDQFLNRMYEIMYPPELRMNTGARVKHVELMALNFTLDPEQKPLRTTRRGRSSYSQGAYEESIFKAPKRLKRLMAMIDELMQRSFMAERIGNNKLLIFFDTINMCQAVADHIQKRYPELKVSKYTQEEDASVLDDYDVIVATPGSAGTAVDIANLQQVFSFVMRSSSQALTQMFGRLRVLKTKECTPKFIYVYTRDIPKHVTYHNKMQQVLRPLALSHDQRLFNHCL